MVKQRYTFKVKWSYDDQEYVGLCDQFPSLSYLDKNEHKALAGIMQLVSDINKNLC